MAKSNRLWCIELMQNVKPVMSRTSFALWGPVCLVLALSGCASTVEEAPDTDPSKAADVRAELAAGYMQRGQLQVARSELQRALEIEPTNSRANHMMALLQARLRHRSEAEEYFKRAIRNDKENSIAMHDYGVFLCQEGKVKEALAQFQAAMDNPLYRGNALTHLRAGECYLVKANDRRAAEKHFRTALEINPGISAALYYMAEISFEDKKYLPARGYIERYFATGRDSSKSLLLAARIEERLGDKKMAATYEEKLRTKYPASQEAKQTSRHK